MYTVEFCLITYIIPSGVDSRDWFCILEQKLVIWGTRLNHDMEENVFVEGILLYRFLPFFSGCHWRVSNQTRFWWCTTFISSSKGQERIHYTSTLLHSTTRYSSKIEYNDHHRFFILFKVIFTEFFVRLLNGESLNEFIFLKFLLKVMVYHQQLKFVWSVLVFLIIVIMIKLSLCCSCVCNKGFCQSFVYQGRSIECLLLSIIL